MESELAKRVEEVEQTQHEKRKLQKKISELEQEVVRNMILCCNVVLPRIFTWHCFCFALQLVGGTRPEETPEFEMAVRKV